MVRSRISPLLIGAVALNQFQTAYAQLGVNVPVPTTVPTVPDVTTAVSGVTSAVGNVPVVGTLTSGLPVTSVLGDVTSAVAGVTSIVGGVTSGLPITSLIGDVTSVVGGVTSIVGGVTSIVGGVTSIVGGITSLIPTLTVIPTTIPTIITTSVTTTISSTTTVVSSLTTTSTVVSTTVTTFSPTVIPTTFVVTTTTTTSSSSSSRTTTTFDNAPQYTGNPFHIESNFGTLGNGPSDGAGRQPLLFNLRNEYTLNGFGYLKNFFDTDVWYTLTGGNNQVFIDSPPAGTAKARRQANQQVLTCRVARTGVLTCSGAGGNIFYTDGTDLYLGASVPAGFSPVTLIAVLDNLSTTTGSATATALPTITQAPYWGNWGSGAIPSGVPVALTTCITLPGPHGPVTSTVTVTSLHCGCTETPIPTSIAMTTSVTTCPPSWGYTAPVTVTVPVTASNAAWNTWNGVVPTGAKGGSTSPMAGGKSSGNSTNGIQTYTGAGSVMHISTGALGLSVLLFALFA